MGAAHECDSTADHHNTKRSWRDCFGYFSLFVVMGFNQFSSLEPSRANFNNLANATDDSPWLNGLASTANQLARRFESSPGLTALALAGQLLSVLGALALLDHEKQDVNEDFKELIAKPPMLYYGFSVLTFLPYFSASAFSITQGFSLFSNILINDNWSIVLSAGVIAFGVAQFYAALYAPLLTTFSDKGWLMAWPFVETVLGSPHCHHHNDVESLVNSPCLTSSVLVGEKAIPLLEKISESKLSVFQKVSAWVGFVMLTLLTMPAQLALTAQVGWQGSPFYLNLSLALLCNIPEAMWHTSHIVTSYKQYNAIKTRCLNTFSRYEWGKVALFSIAHGALGFAACFVVANAPKVSRFLQIATYCAAGVDVSAAVPESIIHVLEHRLGHSHCSHHGAHGDVDESTMIGCC